MSYSLEADQDLDEVGFDDMLMNDAGEYCDEFEEVDFEAMGVDPGRPTRAKPGSEEKVLMLSARYAAGLPLWHDHDCTDHGPGRGQRTDDL